MQLKTVVITIAVLAATMLMSADKFAEARPNDEFQFNGDAEENLLDLAERDLLDDDDEFEAVVREIEDDDDELDQNAREIEDDDDELEASERAFEDNDDEDELEPIERAFEDDDDESELQVHKAKPTETAQHKTCKAECHKLRKNHKKPKQGEKSGQKHGGQTKDHKKPKNHGKHKQCMTKCLAGKD
jgi:hypothetical protein